MESTCHPGRIQVTKETFERLHNKYDFEERKDVFAKGKGSMTTYLLNRNYHQDPLSDEITIDRGDFDISVNQNGPKLAELISNTGVDIEQDTDMPPPPELTIEDGHLAVVRRNRSHSVNSNVSISTEHNESSRSLLPSLLGSPNPASSPNPSLMISPRLDVHRFNPLSQSITSLFSNHTNSNLNQGLHANMLSDHHETSSYNSQHSL